MEPNNYPPSFWYMETGQISFYFVNWWLLQV